MTVTLLLVAAVASAQALKPAPAAKSSAWVQGKTADGQPDLQGTWTNATLIPLQRPKALGAKEFYTQAEKDAMDATPKKPVGASVEAHYDLSQFGLDRSQGKFAPNLRTSMITGPEGRLPDFTAEGQKRVAARAAASISARDQPVSSAIRSAWSRRSSARTGRPSTRTSRNQEAWLSPTDSSSTRDASIPSVLSSLTTNEAKSM